MGTTTRTTLLLMTGALTSWQSERKLPGARKRDNADQCMIARGLSPRWQ
jgi:hypothetical protein